MATASDIPNLLSVTNAEDYTTSYTYDKLGRVTSTTDGNGDVTRVYYDLNGNIVRLTQADGHDILYSYNDRNELVSYVEDNASSFELTGLTPSIYTNANHSLGTIIDDYAEIARDWYDDASSSSTWNTPAGACVRNAQRATVTVLYKFMYDVGFIADVR